jgi:O-succinylbenzoate synthase
MTAHTFDIPMKTRFRGQERRRGMVLSGPAGWGEFSPFSDYDAEVASRWLAAAREAATHGWPEPLRTRIPVNTTVPAVGPGQSLADDIARVEAVRDALGPTGQIRVDANAAWSLDEAVTALTELSRFTLEYAEQPVASLTDMAILRRRVDVKLAADESVRNAEDPLRIAGLEAADIVVLKVQPLGGVRACLAVADACGLPVVVSSAIETSVGIAAGLALAGALPELPYACGLATVALLDGDVCSHSLVADDGTLPVSLSAPEPDLIAKFRADDATAGWWQRRLSDAQAVLDAQAGPNAG